MAKFIEEFYYGNLDPQARSVNQYNGRKTHASMV